MKTFKTLLAAIAIVVAANLHAEEYNSLVVIGTAEDATALADFTTITFADGSMNLLNGSAQVKSYALKDLRKMLFTAETTAVKLPVEPADHVAVYNLQGVKVAERASFDALPHGVYIVKTGNRVTKVKL